MFVACIVNQELTHCFSLQVRILRRGVELLEVGGRIVYSTCSFNPVEDEAVVSNVLSQMNGNGTNLGNYT